MSPETLGAIVRILRESKSVREAACKIEIYLVRNGSDESVGRFYDGYMSGMVEEIINDDHT